MKNWPWIAAGVALVALGIAFLVPMWIAAPGGLLLIVVGLVKWSRDRAKATP